MNVISMPTEHTPPAEMERSYLEYRKGCYRILYTQARRSGILDHLGEPRTAEKLAEAMGFSPARTHAVDALLRALVRFGAVAMGDDPPRYTLTPDFAFDSTEPDYVLLRSAIGEEQVESLVHATSYADIIDALYDDRHPVDAGFGEANKDLWEEFLQTPFYRYWRETAVAAIATPGAHILDLACGPGFGLQELAANVGDNGLVVGVELSRMFVCEAVQRTESLPRVRVGQCDLNDGVPFLRDAFFDGAMLVGALHYLRNRDTLFEDVARVLRPGGRFCISLAHMKRGTYDQELLDLRLALRETGVFAATRPEIVAAAQRHGFAAEPLDEMFMGCYGWFVFERASAEASAR